jgi:hypothetical protein
MVNGSFMVDDAFRLLPFTFYLLPFTFGHRWSVIGYLSFIPIAASVAP